jgi:hypothetical protein
MIGAATAERCRDVGLLLASEWVGFGEHRFFARLYQQVVDHAGNASSCDGARNAAQLASRCNAPSFGIGYQKPHAWLHQPFRGNSNYIVLRE